MTLPEGIFIKQKTKEKNVMNKTEFIAAVAEKEGLRMSRDGYGVAVVEKASKTVD